MKKISLRKDLVTGQMLPSNQLIRIVKTKDGQVLVDSQKKINGRGIYLQPTLTGLELVKKKKLLQKGLKVEVSESLFVEIEQEIITN
jgi:hypothetical protein